MSSPLPRWHSHDIPPSGTSFSPTGKEYPLPTAQDFEEERERLSHHIEAAKLAKRTIIVVVGWGTVGAGLGILAATLPRHPYFVIAYNRPSPRSYAKLVMTNQGIPPFEMADPLFLKRLREALAIRTLYATFLKEAIVAADIILVATQFDVEKPVFADIRRARVSHRSAETVMNVIGRFAAPNTLVIVESTLPVGFTRKRLLPLLARGMRKRKILSNSDLPLLAYSFERLEPGMSYSESLISQTRVVAGVNQRSARRAMSFFKSLGFRVIGVSSIETAEFIKVAENTWRASLFAIADGLVSLAERIGINWWEVAREIRKRPTHMNLVTPGLRVGGYCLPKEVFLLVDGAVKNFRLPRREVDELLSINLDAVDRNDQRPSHAVELLKEALQELGRSIKATRVAWFGASYKEGVGDIRESGTEVGVRHVALLGGENIVFDPYVDRCPWGRVIKTDDPIPYLDSNVGAIVLATRHPVYVGQAYGGHLSVRRLIEQLSRRCALLDCQDFLADSEIRMLLSAGWAVRGLGKGHIPHL